MILNLKLSKVKARLQALPINTINANLSKNHAITPYRGTADLLVRIVKTEGTFSLYRGFGAIIVGGTPGTTLYLCGYDWFKYNLMLVTTDGDEGEGGFSSFAVPDFAVHFCSGMLAETLACIVYVPVDVVKERLQVQGVSGETSQRHQYNGSMDALRKILKTEGLTGIYTGYGATLASFGPFSALYFIFYEQMKSWSKQFLSLQDEKVSSRDCQSNRNSSNDTDLPLSFLITSSAGAGAAAAWITSPLDMAKLRLQIQRRSNGTLDVAHSANLRYIGMVDFLLQTYYMEGVRGLFRGATARVIHFVPATAITMTCYEKCRSFYAQVFSRR